MDRISKSRSPSREPTITPRTGGRESGHDAQLIGSHLTDQTAFQKSIWQQKSTITVVQQKTAELGNEDVLRLSDLGPPVEKSYNSVSEGPSPAISNNERLVRIQQIQSQNQSKLEMLRLRGATKS